MQAPILNMFKYSEATLNRDRSRDLFIISQFEAFKREVYLFIINIINVLNVVQFNKYSNRYSSSLRTWKSNLMRF
jgi:hypothetical protein